MDIRMPELDGLEATRRLCGPTAAPRVLILTTLRPRRVRLRGDEGRRERIPAQGRPPRAARRRGPGRRRRRRAPRPGDHPPPDRGVRAPAAAGLRRTAELSELTERELEVLKLIARGLSNTEIARTLFLSEATVKTHVTHILAKLGLRDRVQAVVLAYESGLVQPAHR